MSQARPQLTLLHNVVRFDKPKALARSACLGAASHPKAEMHLWNSH